LHNIWRCISWCRPTKMCCGPICPRHQCKPITFFPISEQTSLKNSILSLSNNKFFSIFYAKKPYDIEFYKCKWLACSKSIISHKIAATFKKWLAFGLSHPQQSWGLVIKININRIPHESRQIKQLDKKTQYCRTLVSLEDKKYRSGSDLSSEYECSYFNRSRTIIKYAQPEVSIAIKQPKETGLDKWAGREKDREGKTHKVYSLKVRI